MSSLRVGNRVREAGDNGPFDGKVIEVLDSGQVRVVWFDDERGGHGTSRSADTMSPSRLEKYEVKEGDPGPAGLRRTLSLGGGEL